MRLSDKKESTLCPPPRNSVHYFRRMARVVAELDPFRRGLHQLFLLLASGVAGNVDPAQCGVSSHPVRVAFFARAGNVCGVRLVAV